MDRCAFIKSSISSWSFRRRVIPTGALWRLRCNPTAPPSATRRTGSSPTPVPSSGSTKCCRRAPAARWSAQTVIDFWPIFRGEARGPFPRGSKPDRGPIGLPVVAGKLVSAHHFFEYRLMRRAVIGVLILPVGLLCSCSGSASRSTLPSPPHGGNIIELPDSRGFLELKTVSDAPSTGGRAGSGQVTDHGPLLPCPIRNDRHGVRLPRT